VQEEGRSAFGRRLDLTDRYEFPLRQSRHQARKRLLRREGDVVQSGTATFQEALDRTSRSCRYDELKHLRRSEAGNFDATRHLLPARQPLRKQAHELVSSDRMVGDADVIDGQRRQQPRRCQTTVDAF
jgi:hypothetical protein